MLTNNQLKYLQQSGLQPNQIAQVVKYMGGYDRSTAPKSVSGFMGNIVRSGMDAVGQIGGALVNTFNPDIEKNTVANLGKLVIGTLQYIDPTQALGTKYEKNAKAVGQFYLDRYGSVDKVMNTLYSDPVGMALDVSTVLTGVGGALKGAGSVSKIAGLTEAGNAFTKAASFTDPLSLIAKGGKSITMGQRAKLATKLADASENLATRGIGNPAKQAELARKGGRSVASFIDEYNLYDRSPETARSVKKGIINKYDELALNSGNQVRMGQLVKAFNDEITRLSQGVNGVISDANQAKIAELVRRRDQLLQASGATVGSSPIMVGTDTLTNFRRNVIDPDVPQSMYNLDARGSGAAQGVKQSRDIIKGAIDSTDPQIAKLGKDYGMAKGMEKILTNAEARGANRQVFNFTRMGSAGLGGIIAGAPAAVGGFAMETLVNHPKFIADTSKGLSKTAKVLNSPRIRMPVAVGKYGTPAYNYTRYGRMANATPNQKTPISTNTQTQPQRQSEKRAVSPSSVSPRSSYTPTPKLPTYKMPKQSKSGQAFSGSVKVNRGSFY